MSIKIKLNDDGSVDPEVMRLLRELAEHRDQCPTCEKAHAMWCSTGMDHYCQQGMALIAELCQHPSVSDGADLEKKINESN